VDLTEGRNWLLLKLEKPSILSTPGSSYSCRRDQVGFFGDTEPYWLLCERRDHHVREVLQT